MSQSIHTSDFRDTISTSDKQGGRIWIYPKIWVGDFYKLRMMVAYFLISIFTLGPFLEYQGHPVFLFNVLERKFIFFGVPFWPQDMPIIVLAFLTSIVFIIVFTVAFGRLWCGWACPQTVFMEMVFRKIDYWIEGDSSSQKRLDESNWTAEKIWKKFLKHTVYLLISFTVGNIFLAYLIGKENLWQLIIDGPIIHWGQMMALLVFTAVFYIVFSKLREIACVLICPYGRLQSVLLDKKTIAVSYDYVRGEPRGHIKKGQDNSGKGDCVDCKLCINVCPTGIDIRNGLQMECIQCTACMDACNSVMHKIGKPKGLIRYASEDGIKHSVQRLFSARVAAYSAVLITLFSILMYIVFSRPKVETTILRTPGLTFQKLENGYISNLYNIEIINKTFDRMPVDVAATNTAAKIKWIGTDQIIVPEAGMYKGSFFLEIPEDNLSRVKNEVMIQIRSGGKTLEEIKTSFLAPGK